MGWAARSRRAPCHGQEALLAIGPKQRVERLDALLARGLDRGAPAALERALEQRRQHVLQRPPLEMVEIDFGTRRRSSAVHSPLA